jgi:hypothetical protein
VPCFDEVSDFKGGLARGIAYVQLYVRILNGLPSFSLQKEDNDIALSVIVVDAQFESFLLGTPFFQFVDVHIRFPARTRTASAIDWKLGTSVQNSITIIGSENHTAIRNPNDPDLVAALDRPMENADWDQMAWNLSGTLPFAAVKVTGENGTFCKFAALLDTRASVNLVSLDRAKQVGLDLQTRPITSNVKSFTGTKIDIDSSAMVNLDFGDGMIDQQIEVLTYTNKGAYDLLLGYPAMKQLGIELVLSANEPYFKVKDYCY